MLNSALKASQAPGLGGSLKEESWLLTESENLPTSFDRLARDSDKGGCGKEGGGGGALKMGCIMEATENKCIRRLRTGKLQAQQVARVYPL